MRRAQCLLPDGPNYRRQEFLAGLREADFELADYIEQPRPGDVLLIWNRGPAKEAEALRFERVGAAVLVVENGYLGKQWIGRKWFAIARGHHAGAGSWPEGGAHRWDNWGFELAPWRTAAGELVILAQRGIGEPGIASPPTWAQDMQRIVGGRIRPHPGVMGAPSLEEGLQDAEAVVTWSSGAALIAMTMGIPVWYGLPCWIGASAARHVLHFGRQEPLRDDVARLKMFQRLAWAMWSADEVRTGAPFRELLCEC